MELYTIVIKSSRYIQTRAQDWDELENSYQIITKHNRQWSDTKNYLVVLVYTFEYIFCFLTYSACLLICPLPCLFKAGYPQLQKELVFTLWTVILIALLFSMKSSHFRRPICNHEGIRTENFFRLHIFSNIYIFY